MHSTGQGTEPDYKVSACMYAAIRDKHIGKNIQKDYHIQLKLPSKERSKYGQSKQACKLILQRQKQQKC